MDLRPPATRREVFSDYYCPIEAGYKDRSGVLPYDKAACRALESTYRKPEDVAGSEERTLFVGKLPSEVEEADLEKAFSRYGALQETRLIRDLVTGAPRGYAFVVFARRRDAAAARADCRRLCIAGADVVVEAEFSRGLANWRPRRLGGGLGGKKESGQLRFGGAARPFQVPVSDPAAPGPGWQRRAERAGPAAGQGSGGHHSELPAGRRTHRDGGAGSDRRCRRQPKGATGEWSEQRHHSDGAAGPDRRCRRQREGATGEWSEQRHHSDGASGSDRHQPEGATGEWSEQRHHSDGHGYREGQESGRSGHKRKKRHRDTSEDGDKHRDRHGDKRGDGVKHRHKHKDERGDSAKHRNKHKDESSDRRRGSDSDQTSDRGSDGHGGKRRRSDKHSEKHRSRHKAHRDREETKEGDSRRAGKQDRQW